MEAAQYPSPETIQEICEQTRRVSGFIRDGLPTTSAPRRFGANALPGVIAELDKLTYLFFGRTLADYDADIRTTAARGAAVSLAGWIVATPGPGQHQFFDVNHQQSDLVLQASYHGWPNPVPAYADALFAIVATLRVYFGQLVFYRNCWIHDGEWLRQQIRSCTSWVEEEYEELYGPTPEQQLGPWFDTEWCRMPMYPLRKPERLRSAMDTPPTVPPEIERCGTFGAPKTDGVPSEWLDEMDHFAAALLSASSDGGATEPAVDLVTIGQLAALAGVARGTFHNRLDKDKPAIGRHKIGRETAIHWAEIRPWLLGHWPLREHNCPVDIEKVRQILAAKPPKI